ncbi:LysR family transcriptional regulator [Cupriavidus plantarum]|nr:LysR family transcriptional regulator [Cupriavidus plantarum]
MRLFIRVVETGNFSKAARAAGISQPTASKIVAGLEERLGAQLLNRSSRGLSLTEAGQRFYDGAVDVVDRVDEVEALVEGGEAAPSGIVRVALSPAFGRMMIVPHLPRFLARYPEVSIEFSVEQRYVNLIENGIDLAIRIGPLADSTEVARRIGSTQYATVASPAYLARAGADARVRRLPRGDLRGGSAPRDPLACRAGIRAMPAGPLPATSSRVVLDDGGMTIFKAKDLAEATRIATDDPTVKSGFLNVEVKMMWVPFH